ncbi:hypothetical protein BH09MYX1_BH09MYX1_45340 [soil metagenome]
MISTRARRLTGFAALPLSVIAIAVFVDCVGDTPATPVPDSGVVDTGTTPDSATPDGGGSGDADASAPVVTEVATGLLHACAVFSDGHVDCWGDNTYGQLGAPIAQNGTCNGGTGTTFGCRVDPVRVAGITNAKHIAAGAGFTCIIDAQNAVSCFGLNNAAQLGHPIGQGDAQCVGADSQARACNATPTLVSNATGVAQISLGAAHACIRTQANSVSCWGSNSQGELGIGTTAPFSATLVTPVGLPGPISDVTAGFNFDTCVTTVTGGQVWCWGFADWAQIGARPPPVARRHASVTAPRALSGPRRSTAAPFDNYSRVWLGQSFSCAQTSGGGAVQCWGIPYSYKITAGLGVPNGTVVNEPIPAEAGTTGFEVRAQAA